MLKKIKRMCNYTMQQKIFSAKKYEQRKLKMM